MTDHTGVLLEVREALAMQGMADDVILEARDRALECLDALIEAVPEKSNIAMWKKRGSSEIAAKLLHQATKEKE